MKHRTPLLAAAALAALTISCAPHARVGVYADVPGPPSLSFQSDPYLVPLPGTYAYAVADYDVDLYYADGYYWRPWQGRWYRSSRYDRGWVSYSGVPVFYGQIPRDWRSDYHSHRWHGRDWDYARVPRHEVERNWSTWKRERRWDNDPRRYSGDRRWHDDRRDSAGRDRDRRDWNQRDEDRRGADVRERQYDREPSQRADDPRDYDRRDAEGRVIERSGNVRAPVDRREVERRDAERRQMEERRERAEAERYEAERRGVERRGVERREVEGRSIQRREVEEPNVAPGRPEFAPRPVAEDRRNIERQPGNPDDRGEKGRGPAGTPRGRGAGGPDKNRDGIDDRTQRPL